MINLAELFILTFQQDHDSDHKGPSHDSGAMLMEKLADANAQRGERHVCLWGSILSSSDGLYNV